MSSGGGVRLIREQNRAYFPGKTADFGSIPSPATNYSATTPAEFAMCASTTRLTGGKILLPPFGPRFGSLWVGREDDNQVALFSRGQLDPLRARED